MSTRARYGLEIIRYLQEATDLVVTEGTIYPILARLTKNGLVEAEWIAGRDPRLEDYLEDVRGAMQQDQGINLVDDNRDPACINCK